MNILINPRWPVEWPSPYSATARAVGWFHFIGTAALAACCWLGSAALWFACAALGLAVVCAAFALALPVAALGGLGWFLRVVCRRLTSGQC